MFPCLFERFLTEKNSANSTGLEWENLVLHSMCSSGCNGLYGQNFGIDSSSENPTSAFQEFIPKNTTDGFGTVASLPLHKSMNEDILRMQKMNRSISTSVASVCSSEQTIGLNLGRKMQYNDGIPPSITKTSVSSFPMPPSMTKRSRTLSQSMQNSSCQVEGCNLDLTSAKEYHRRHRICESHSKSPKVIVAGMERRFCQQCSRFHGLLEFDDKKRSCRRRLSDHNARRRRLQPNQSIQLSSAGFSASFDRSSTDSAISVSNSTRENTTTSMSTTQARHSVIRPSKAEGFQGADDFSKPISGLKVINSERLSSIQSSSPQVLDQCSHVPTTHFPIATSLPSTHSLLSTNSWSLNESKSTSGPHHGELLRSNQIHLEEGPHFGSIHAINLHNAGTTQLQEFQLFQVPF